MTVGYSEFTKVKQKDLTAIFSTMIRCSDGAIRNMIKNGRHCDPRFWVFDLNCGEGKPNGDLGSPLIFLDILSKRVSRRSVLVMIDNDPDCIKKLTDHISEIPLPSRLNVHNQIFCDEQETVLSDYDFFLHRGGKLRYGICYQDFNGAPDFNILAKFSEIACYWMTDILINVNVTQLKRNAGLKNSHKKDYSLKKEFCSLEEGLRRINKRYWQIRGPLGRWNWTLVLGTNWNACPKFSSLGFKPLDLRTEVPV